MTDTDYKTILDEARRAQVAVYLATDSAVAKDLSRIIETLADDIEILLKALGESRQRFGDSETKRAELEAVIQRANDLITRGEWPQDIVVEVSHGLSASSSVVLQDRDREVAARAWDEAKERYNDENFREGCVCFNAEHRGKYPAMHWLNPYRADQIGEQS